MVQLCHFTHQQTKGRIPKLPCIVLFAAQLTGEDMFQLGIVTPGKRNVLSQLVDGQRIAAVLHDVAVHTFPVLAKIVAGIQRFALGLFQYRVGKGRVDRLLPLAALHQKLDEFPQLLPHFLKVEKIMRGQKFVCLHLPDEGQLCLHLRDGSLPFQHCRCAAQLFLGAAQSRQTFQFTEQQAIHKVIEPLGGFIFVVQRDERCNLFHQGAFVRFGQADKGFRLLIVFHGLSVQPHGYQLRVQRSHLGTAGLR